MAFRVKRHSVVVSARSKNRIFDNAGLYAFFLYYFAGQINDLVALWMGFGGVLTPRQFAIVVGIAYLAHYRGSDSSVLFRKSIPWLQDH